MTNEFIVFVGFALVILMVSIVVLWARLKEAEHLIRRMDGRISANYRLHKDDYFEQMGKHGRLIEALDLVEAPASRTRYVKKGNV